MLGSRANAVEVGGVLRVNESTKCATFRDDWKPCEEGRSVEPSRSERGADYLFYNPHNERGIFADDACPLASAPHVHLPPSHQVCWDFKALEMYEGEPDRDGVGTGMPDKSTSWDSDVLLKDDIRDQLMTEAGYYSVTQTSDVSNVTTNASPSFGGGSNVCIGATAN